jgi:hypothetical protein
MALNFLVATRLEMRRSVFLPIWLRIYRSRKTNGYVPNALTTYTFDPSKVIAMSTGLSASAWTGPFCAGPQLGRRSGLSG